ncbi:hypothetical protein M426DRAFT_14186 [Hypoxylon sp. CI-4A]|nr:hypothetical protein M426DRAFT_14186 [Hypoxylon sp. CI-4A]
MKTSFVTIGTYMLASLSGALAGPSPLPLGVEIFERDGVTHIREAPFQELGAEKRCNNCANGSGCTVGKGQCKKGSYCPVASVANKELELANDKVMNLQNDLEGIKGDKQSLNLRAWSDLEGTSGEGKSGAPSGTGRARS